MSMRLPAPLLRRNPHVHKNTFGHVLVLAGSRNMIGAAALAGLAAMRAGAGLVTLGVPKSLNSVLQKKISPVIMTLPLRETKEQTLAFSAYGQLKRILKNYQAIAIGPGLSRNKSTQKFILKVIENATQPMVLDADALTQGIRQQSWRDLAKMKFWRARHRSQDTRGLIKILTPHVGEMARLIGKSKEWVEANRREAALRFAKENRVVLLLKGPRTIVASPDGKIYVNKTGNPGMATAGSGDVLAGMIAALLGQGIPGFEAAKFGSYLHGKAGDLAAGKKTRAGMIAMDIIENIPKVIKKLY